MKKINMKKVNEAGSLMIEAIAMLGLISLVTPVVYKKSAERMTELQDINAATQIRTLSKAIDTYLQDNYEKIVEEQKKGDGTWDTGEASQGDFSISDADLAKYLPTGMVDSETGKVTGTFDDYKFSYTTNNIGGSGAAGQPRPHYILTGYVGAKEKDGLITPQRASRIATMVGSNGGYVEEGEDHKMTAYGVNGIWQAKLDKLGMEGIAPGEGEDNVTPIVAASTSAVSSAGSYVDTRKFLHRADEGDPELNTMETDIYMWGNEGSRSIKGINQLLVGYQNGEGGVHGAVDPDTNPDNYGLYLTSGKNTWLGGTLQAAAGALTVESGKMQYKRDGGGQFLINDSGMAFQTSNNEKFVAYNGVMEFGNGDSQLIQAQYANGDKPTEVRIMQKNGEAKLAVNENTTTVNNQLLAQGQFVANQAGTYNEKKLSDKYTTASGEQKDFIVDVKNNETVLTGKTYATQIETGYLQTHEFDTLRLNAGKENWTDANWNLTANEDEVNIGKRGKATIDVYSNGAETDKIEMKTTGTGGSISLEANKGGNVTISSGTAEDNGGDINVSSAGAGGMLIGTVDGATKGVAIASKDNAAIELTKNMYATAEGNILIAQASGPDGLMENSDLKSGVKGIAISDKNTTMQGKDVHIRANSSTGSGEGEGEGSVATDGLVTVESKNLWVDNNAATTGESLEAGPRDASVYIRHGAIELKTETESGGAKGALGGSGYVKADRFVVDNSDQSISAGEGVAQTLSRDPRDVYKGQNISGTENNLYETYVNKEGTTLYDHYMVDPAYTSVMHDIKLTSRGGARLSDILPDFINKGIYIVNNSYSEDMARIDIVAYEDGKEGVNMGSSEFASAWSGRVPAPQCPPGYAKVITIMPAGWRMAQTGSLNMFDPDGVEGNDDDRLYLIESVPTLDDVDKEDVECRVEKDSGGTVTKVTCPHKEVFQGSTWLKLAYSPLFYTTKTPYSEDNYYFENYDKKSFSLANSTFNGWMVRMGYLYPANIWGHFVEKDGDKIKGKTGIHVDEDEYLKVEGADAANNEDRVYWNLLPVDKYSMEGYATVYCYFDREGLTNPILTGDDKGKPQPYFNPAFVDVKTRNTDNSIVEQGTEKEDAAYKRRLFNPNLSYDQDW